MQRTIRILRVALPLAFVAFIVVIALSWTTTRRSRDHASTDPIVPTRTGEHAQVESKGFEDTQTDGSRVISYIRAGRVVAYSSSWTTLEDVHLTIYRPNGLTYELVCPAAQFNSKTKEAEAKGGVRLTSSDGVSIATSEIHYDGTRLANNIPVEFTIDRWKGNAGALDLNIADETLRLFERLTATMIPARPGEAPMTLTSDEGVFRRRENDVTFAKTVELARNADRLRADHMVGRFAQDRRTLMALEGQGNVTVAMSSAAAPGEDLGGAKQITCDRFFSEIAPTGQINAITAVGDAGPAHAVLNGPPLRDIVARSFRIALAQRAVSEIKAESQVTMKELGVPPREVTAENVTVSFDPASHKASSAFLDGNVKYHDPRNQASALRANYDISGDRVVLTAQPGFDPTVVTDGNILKANQIEFSPRAGTARAVGSVIAQLSSKANGPTADSTNVFPAGKPVFVNADSLTLRQATKIAVFSGNVRAWQDTNLIQSQELQVQGGGETISARGNVRSILYNLSNNDPAKRNRMTSRSDQLFARRNERKIDLNGSVTIDDGLRALTSEKATFSFDGNRKLERVDVEKNVSMTDRATSRKGSGDKAVYSVLRRSIVVSGSPATVVDPTGNLSGQQIQIDLARNKVEVLGTTSPTRGSYKPSS